MHKDLTGMKFGKLSVAGRANDRKNNRGYRLIMWKCVCDCGGTTECSSGTLKRGNSKSCGCNRGERHGKSGTLYYAVWVGMIARCERSETDSFQMYGGRGISVCPRWKHSFLKFQKDMGPRPKGMSIDRIDTNGNYEPKNCRWATPKQQSRNTRRNVVLSVNGESMCISEWEQKMNLPRTTIWQRIRKLGWTPEKAVTTPLFVIHRN